MATLEQKIDLILNWIATNNEDVKKELSYEAAEMLSTINFNSYTVDDIIDDLFKEIGMPPHLLGYSYASLAVKMVIENPTYINHIVSLLYPGIAAAISPSTIPSRVERTIRHAIEACFERIDFDTSYRIFGSAINPESGKPTNSEFIAACVREVKRRMRYNN